MISTGIKLRLARCQVCGLTFGVDAATYFSAMRDRDPISCPLGHRPAIAWSDADALDMAASNVQLLSELQQKTYENNALRARLASMPSNAEAVTDKKELNRRCEMLAARAPLSNNREPLCIFCGRPQLVGLRDHLRRQHAPRVAAMPADSFI
jgi:hypothetical protein